MPELFFIRHAESEANARQEYASFLPIPITKLGHQEAAISAKNFAKKFQADRIIASSLHRAQQTAQYFANELQLPIETSELIVEQNMGKYTGMKYDDVKNCPHWQPDPSERWSWTPPENGESYQMVADRVQNFLETLSNCHQQKILIITHGVTLRLIKGTLLNTLPQYPTEIAQNCGIMYTNFIKLGQPHEIQEYFLGQAEQIKHAE